MKSVNLSAINFKQTGAILLAVLVVAIALVILLGVVSFALNNRISVAQQAKVNLQDNALIYAKASELTYLLSTQRITFAGVSTGKNPQGLLKDSDGFWQLAIIGDEIRLDGFTYVEQNQLSYRIQDEAGLIAINASGQWWLKKALASYGLSVSDQAEFADVLADYADSDAWRRPSGAENYAYQKAKRPLPRNYLLQSCSELWRLETWSLWLTTHEDWLSFCSLSRNETLNLNSVPLDLWQRLWPNSAVKMRGMRQTGKWLVTHEDTLALEPALSLIIDEYIKTAGGQTVSLYVTKGGERRTVRLAIGEGRNKPFVWK